jgi:hypothetical protein
VSQIRSEAGMTALTTSLRTISDTTLSMATAADDAGDGHAALRAAVAAVTQRLRDGAAAVSAAAEEGRRIADESADDDAKSEMKWRVWTQSLPGRAFEVAREVRELVAVVEGVAA